MAKEIDTKVVEMRFDNSQFEKETKTTMNTLEKLKEALKFGDAGKGLKDVDKAVKGISLEGLAAGIDVLTKRFSLMGTISNRVVENLVDGLMNKLSGAIKATTDSIVSGGVKRAMNIENAHFQLQALLKDETKVQAIMKDASASVDGTAYSYDEAAKAAAQFAASGLQAGDQMLGALKGITGVAAMTNSSFEDISRVFTTVAGNGRLMGDQLLQLSSRGLNAASTLADYFKEVRGQADMTEGAIREMVSKGELDFATFADAMNWAFGESAARANETFTGAMSNVKSALARIGAEFVSPLIEQNSELVKMFNALRLKINEVKGAIAFDEQKSALSGLMDVTSGTKEEFQFLFDTVQKDSKAIGNALQWIESKGTKSVKGATQALLDYINGVQNGTIRASYATNLAVQEMTQSTQLSMEGLQYLLSIGAVDAKIFTSAMEHEYGNLRTIAKQTTDFILDTVKSLTTWVDNLDLSGPIEVMNDGFQVLKNIMASIHRIVTPIGQAFASVFSFKFDNILAGSKALVKFTQEMKISMNTGNKVHTIFKAIFNVLKTGIDIIWNVTSSLTKGLFPIVTSLGGALLDFIAWISSGINALVDFGNNSKVLSAIFDGLYGAFSKITKGMSGAIDYIRRFVKTIDSLEIVKNVKGWFSNAFSNIDKQAGEAIEFLIKGFGELIKTIGDFAEDKGLKVFDYLSESLKELWKTLTSINWTNPTEVINAIAKAFRNLCDTLMENPGIRYFVESAKEFGHALSEAFNWDELKNRFTKNKESIKGFFGWLGGETTFDEGVGDGLKTVKEAIQDFMKWIGGVVEPFFSDLTIGGVLSTAGGFGIITSMLKLSKSLDQIVKKVSVIPDTIKSFEGVLDSVKKTLIAYQKEIMADTILKIAGAIAVLAGALVLLTFADPTRLMDAAGALVMIGGAIGGIIFALSKFKDAGQIASQVKPMTKFATAVKGLSKAFKRAATILALGHMIKDIGKTLIMIVGSIIALGIFYTQNPEGFAMGLKVVEGIGLFLTALLGIGILLGQFAGKGVKNFSKGASGILKISLSLNIIVKTLDKLMKMKFSEDWVFKMIVLGAIMTGLGLLAVAFGEATPAKDEGKFQSSALLMACAGIYVVTMALEKIMTMQFDDYWIGRLLVLAGIMAGVGGLILAVGKASKDAKGNLKATGTILALALAVGAIVVALGFLIEYPLLKMMSSAVILGGLLLALGFALRSAGKITDPSAAKAVLNMAITIGAIVAALGFLSMIKTGDLMKAIVALGVILGILAGDLYAASKITDKAALNSIVAMVFAVATITISLYALAQQPWAALLAGAGSLSAVLLALAGALKIVRMSKIDGKIWNELIIMGTMLAGVTAALMFLSGQPWEGLLAGAVGLSAVLLALTQMLKMISSVKIEGNIVSILEMLLLMIVPLAAISVALYFLSEQPWEGLLAGAVGLSAVLLALAEATAIVAKAGTGTLQAALTGIAMLDLFIANLAIVIGVLGALNSDSKFEEVCTKGVDLLVLLFEGLGRAVGAIISGAILQVSEDLITVGDNLSTFMKRLQPFIDGAKDLANSGADEAVGVLATAVLKISQANFIDGVGKIFKADLPTFGTELSNFMKNLDGFLVAMNNVNPQAAEASSYVAEAITKITSTSLVNGIMRMIGITGDMGEFAEDLKEFGSAAKSFTDQVSGISKEDAETAQAVSDVMFAIGEATPAYGGLLAFFEGKQGLGDFGENLKSFGTSVASFAETVKDVEPKSVEGARQIGEMFATLNEMLPESGSVKGWLFGGDQMSFQEFGGDLESFGAAMVDFSTRMKDLDTFSIVKASNGFKVVVDLADYVKGKSADDLVKFSKKLKEVGADAVDKFKKAFTDSEKQVQAAVKSLIDAAKKGLETGDKDLQAKAKKLGENLATAIQNGMKGNILAITNTALQLALRTFSATQSAFNGCDFQSIGSNMVKSILNGWKSHEPALTGYFTNWINGFKYGWAILLSPDEFAKIAKNIGQGLINGYRQKSKEVENWFTNWINGFKYGWIVMLSPNEFIPIGENIGKGLIKGMQNQRVNVERTGKEIGQAAAKAVKAGAEVRSPSRITTAVGKFLDEGLIVGMQQLMGRVISKGEEVGEGSANAMFRAVQSALDIIDQESFDLSPVITPVVDLSNVQQNAREIGSLFNQTYDLSELYKNAQNTAALFQANQRPSNESKDTLNGDGENSPTYVFEQNNYSPKALSAGEIYRQTNNQISAFKRMVGTA